MPGEPLDIIAAGRPLPQVLQALSVYLESAAAEWDRREAELRRSEAFLAQAQRLTKTGSLWWKPSTGEIVWSDENYRLMEYPPGITPTVELALQRCHPDDAQFVQEKLAALSGGGASTELEHRLLVPGGRVKHVRVIFQNIGTPEVPELIGAATDITEWKEAEERLREREEALGSLRAELARVSRAASIGALTASIAHEVNQPLAGIVTNASTCLRMLLADPPDVHGARETARRTIRDADRAASVISRVRALLARKPPAMEPVDLNDAAREVLALSRSELQRADAVTRLELAPGLPLVHGDRVQLQQVILNLIRNAIEAMNGVQRREIVVRTAREGGGVSLSVRDSGAGFDPADAGRLFDAFFTTKADGMGMGLSVSRSIVESHHGRLRATPNDDGPGATFSFSIPASPPPA